MGAQIPEKMTSCVHAHMYLFAVGGMGVDLYQAKSCQDVFFVPKPWPLQPTFFLWFLICQYEFKSA